MEQKILKTVEETNLNLTEISKLFGISKEKIVEILIKNGYYDLKDNSKARLPTVKKLRNAALYFLNNNIAYSNVAKMFKVSKLRLKEYLEKWYPNKTTIQSNYNDNIFDVIDTEEKAYWLGFIFADGYINSGPLNGETSYKFELTLSSKDIDHLRKFANFVNYRKSISKKTCKKADKEYSAAKIGISSKHLWNVLNSYGCTPRKSLTLKFPDKSIFKDESLIRHFIRGYWDGDGSLGIYDYKVKDYVYHNKCLCSVLGTPEFLLEIQKYLGIDKQIVSAGSDKCPNNAFKLTYACKQALQVCSILYENSKIYLDRKYLKYLEFCRLYEKSYRGLEDNIGEGCDANTEITKESNRSLVS